jgi:hypothetical protein
MPGEVSEHLQLVCVHKSGAPPFPYFQTHFRISAKQKTPLNTNKHYGSFPRLRARSEFVAKKIVLYGRSKIKTKQNNHI